MAFRGWMPHSLHRPFGFDGPWASLTAGAVATLGLAAAETASETLGMLEATSQQNSIPATKNGICMI